MLRSRPAALVLPLSLVSSAMEGLQRQPIGVDRNSMDGEGLKHRYSTAKAIDRASIIGGRPVGKLDGCTA